MRSLIVTEKEAGQRLDKLLAKYMNLAGKGFLYKMIRKKNITLNGKRCDGSERIMAGDEIKLFLSDETIDSFSVQLRPPIRSVPLDVIYEDEHVLLINKPAGILSQKAKEGDESLVEYLTNYLIINGRLTKEQLRWFRPSVCNRLDRNTSGLIVAGTSQPGLRIMSEAFRDRRLKKYYRCVVAGRLEDKGRLTGFLRKDEAANQVEVTLLETFGSVPIITEYEPLGYAWGLTLLNVRLVTGRPHQIRAHMAFAGHPILGDLKYGDEAANKEARERWGIHSQMLHSFQVTFPELPRPLAHLSGQSFTAPLPRVFHKICGDWS